MTADPEATRVLAAGCPSCSCYDVRLTMGHDETCAARGDDHLHAICGGCGSVFTSKVSGG